jgi:capsular polysaccharide biosynthesis protein
MSNEFSFRSLLKLIKQNFKLLAVLAIVSALAGAIFSGPQFIRPKYKSTLVVFPVNIFPVSIESETEQSQQIFLASAIRDSVIEKFNLWDHWNISREDEKAAYWMDLEYQTNISISRSQFESIVVKVLDYSPDTAKFIADEILKQYNNLASGFFTTKAQEFLDAANVTLAKRTAYIDSLQNRLQELAVNYGVLEYEMQTKELTKSYYEMMRSGASKEKMNEVSLLLDNLKKYGGESLKLATLLKEYMLFYAESIDQRDLYFFETQSEFRYYNLIESPKVAVKKSFPVRWIIVLSSVLVTLLFAIILIAQFNRPKA